MKLFLSSSKITIITQIVIAICLLSLPLSTSYAKAGCCSKHGGVAGCDNATGHQRCKDGTTSPTCACDGTTTVKQKATDKKSWWWGSSTTKTEKAKPVKVEKVKKTKKETKVEKAKTKGCCAQHGGVAKCDKASGYLMCKDGTRSTTCKC